MITERMQELAGISEGLKDFKIHHKTFTSAIDEVLAFVKKNGYKLDDQEFFNSVTSGRKRPAEGVTNNYKLSLYKNGKEQRRMVVFQIYGMRTQFELNLYIS
jgi:SOS response regulatory protein OraA/RecX